MTYLMCTYIHICISREVRENVLVTRISLRRSRVEQVTTNSGNPKITHNPNTLLAKPVRRYINAKAAYRADQAKVAKHPPRELEEPATMVAKHPPERIKTTLVAKHPQGKRPTHARQQSICQRGGPATTTTKYPQGEPAATAAKHPPERISATLTAKHPQGEGPAHTRQQSIYQRGGPEQRQRQSIRKERCPHRYGSKVSASR